MKFKKLAGGGAFKIINQSLPPALRHLGYSPTQIQNIVTYASGTRTLKKAPFINHESLKDKGFTPESLEKSNPSLMRPLTFISPLTDGTWETNFI